MQTIIGINVETTTAKEQDLLVNQRESRAYYEEAYNGSLKKHCEKVILQFTDCNWEIGMDTCYLKNNKVRNSIIFRFYNTKGIDKKALRQELDKYIQAKFKRLFNGA